MVKSKTTSKGGNAVQMAILGASLAGLAASAYFFLGSKGKKNQKHVKAWVIKMKGDVVEKLEMAKEVSEPVYEQIIDSVATEYKKGKKASQVEIDEMAKDLKRHWRTIKSSMKVGKSNVKKEVKNK